MRPSLDIKTRQLFHQRGRNRPRAAAMKNQDIDLSSHAFRVLAFGSGVPHPVWSLTTNPSHRGGS